MSRQFSAMVCMVVASFFILQANDLSDNAKTVPIHKNLVADSIVPINSNSAVVSVISDPAGASVFLDEKRVGESPLIIDSVTFGSHNLEIRKKGYYLKRAEFMVASSDSISISMTLTSPAQLTTLSEPDSAFVKIDSISKGKTPLSITPLKPGEYKVELSKPGYQTVQKNVVLQSGASDTIRVSLVPEQAQKTISRDASLKSREPISMLSIVTTAMISLALIILLIE